MTRDDVEAALREALTAQPSVRFAMLFGSAATGDVDRARDVDVAVAFHGSPTLFELGSLAAHLESIVGKPVDVVDLDDASTLLRWEVARTGRVVSAADADALLAFRARAPLEYADLRPYLDREAAGLRRALGIER